MTQFFFPQKLTPKERTAFILILLLGMVLRLYHLGVPSFWLDEAGVALAARASSLAEMLQVVRSHVLAMPLDYLVVWLFGRISTQEAVLRLPSAIWGTASLLVAYPLYRRFLPPLPALLGLLFFSLAPLHIQYSQELRFYASLVFFYLLSTLLLWDALKEATARRWILFTGVAILGVFFHPYVLFSFANGLVWLALRPQQGTQARKQRVNFLMSATICLLTFLAGYMTFSASNTFRIPLMVFEESPLAALATGLGWLPFYPGNPGLSWVWGFMCALLEGLGAWIIIKKQPCSPLAGLVYSILLQIGAVIGSDLLGHYFFAPRQLLMLLPLLYLLAGLGAQHVIQFVNQIIQSIIRPVNGRLATYTGISLVVALITLASLPALQANWQDDKGDTRALNEVIFKNWHPGASVLVFPAFDGFVYKYYIEYVSQRDDISQQLWGASWDEVLNTRAWDNDIFLVSPTRLTQQETSQLQSLGFSPLFHSYPQSRYAKILWFRSVK